MKDLLPCPFCGGRAEIINIDEGENAGGSCVCCTVCIREADRGQALTTTGIVGLGGLGVIIERTEEAAALFTQGSGLLDRAQAAVVAYWPILLVAGAGLLLWRYFDQIKAARVEDARAGRNVSR